MKERIIQYLTAVITTLNDVTVCGKQNLVNLYSSISAIEESVKMVSELQEHQKNEVCDGVLGD